MLEEFAFRRPGGPCVTSKSYTGASLSSKSYSQQLKAHL
jgi:hypothetical protein